jgi:3-demethoxyubiquinol 3-hydroxylase
MPDPLRHLSPLDRILSVVDQGLRVSWAAPRAISASGRPAPQPAGSVSPAPLDPATARHVAGLMRVNHAGEVAAQALYHGQALVARDPAVREFLQCAAREEGDHLVWCAERLESLHSHTSRLNPLWYAGSVVIGAIAGLSGDAISLGFIAETERQVEGHLEEHLARLPAEDTASRAIIEQMKQDELQHRDHALKHGGAELPAAVRAVMRGVAKLMTSSAYWV